LTFILKLLPESNEVKKYLIEIKPKKQTIPPPQAKKQTKVWKDKALTFCKE
jgi:hypothetical protein